MRNPIQDASSPDLDDMLRHAERLESNLKSGNTAMHTVVAADGPDDNSDDECDVATMLRRADDLLLQIKKTASMSHTTSTAGSSSTAPTVEEKADGDRDDCDDYDHDKDDVLERAGTIAAQIRTSHWQSQFQSNALNPMEKQSVVHRPRDALTVTTCAELPHVQRHIIGSTKEMDYSAIKYLTPRAGLPATVSMDEEDIDNSATVDGDTSADVDTMLLKADLLSRTIRSAAIGQLNTPELIRASDEILKRAKVKPTVSSTTTPENSTPLLLQRANKILNHPQHAATHGDLSVDTFCEESMDTEPVCNYQQSTSSSLLLSRPPRPPAPLRTPSGASPPALDVATAATSTTTLPITPSPKSSIQQQQQQLFRTQSETTNVDHVTMERVIKTLQQVPTSKQPPDSPLITPPTSVALKTMDSDDYSSVGSGSARSITTTTAKSTAQAQDISTSATAANDNRPTTTTMLERVNSFHSCSNQSNCNSVVSVAEAEDIAKEMAKALEETLSQSHSSSVLDDHKLSDNTDTSRDHSTTNAKMIFSPPFGPRQLVMSSSPTTTPTKNNNSNANSPSNNSRELAKLEVWEQHDAVIGLPDKYDYKSSSPSSSRLQRYVPEVQWESMAPVKAGDQDYVPLQDFRKNKVTSRSLGAGLMPVRISKKRSWKTRRNSYIRATGFLLFGVVVMAMVMAGFSDMISLPFAVPMLHRFRGTLETSSNVIPVVVTTTTANPEPDHTTWASTNNNVLPNKKDDPVLLEAKTIKSKKLDEPKVPKIDKHNMSKPKLEVVPDKLNSDQTPSLVSRTSKTVTAPVPSKVESVPVQQPSPPTYVAVKVSVNAGRSDDHAWVHTEPIQRERIPGRCFVPLGYLAFSDCRKAITKEKPLFNVHGLTDCMLQ